MYFLLDLVIPSLEHILRDNQTSSKRCKAINWKHLNLKGLGTLWWIENNEILGHH